MTAFEPVVQGLKTFFSDVAQGFFEITHNGFALVGLVVVFATAALTFKPELRITSEAQLISWLQARQADAMGMVADLAGIERLVVEMDTRLKLSGEFDHDDAIISQHLDAKPVRQQRALDHRARGQSGHFPAGHLAAAVSRASRSPKRWLAVAA